MKHIRVHKGKTTINFASKYKEAVKKQDLKDIYNQLNELRNS